MILKSLKLGNIRSYTSQEVFFPEGATLLCGDIGSGKSTILLAIEFALFGVRRTELPGSALLRKGKNEGYVELKLDIEGKEYVIKRTLKKTANGIAQTAGYIIRDGIKTDATAVELKSIILDLLGYPKELVTKSKSLVYRYTVYTPQEQMKQILMDEKEHRIDTLRKVFGIDKYKRISENAVIFIDQIRKQRNELSGMVSDLEVKKKELLLKEEELKKAEENIQLIAPSIKEMQAKVNEIEAELRKTEENVSLLNNLKSSIKVCEEKLQGKVLLNQQKNKELEIYQKEIEDITKKINDSLPKLTELESSLKDIKPDEKEKIQSQIDDTQKILDEINKRITQNETLKNGSEKLKQDIEKLENCPTCLQPVESEHKIKVSKTEDEKIQKLGTGIAELLKQKTEKESLTKTLKQEREKIVEQANRIERSKLEYNNLKNSVEDLKKQNEDRNNRLKTIADIQATIKQEVAEINREKIETNEKIVALKDVDQGYADVKKKHDEEKQKMNEINTKAAVLNNEKDNIQKWIAQIKTEVESKTKSKQRLEYLTQLQNWLKEYFINLMGVIEKHIMLRVHREFDSLFQTWFKTLIEDEDLGVRLDDEFSPVVQQNGYETEIDNLSGGEKTALALAYRLSLNKVINDIISSIKTKDIIILDEPTDGFSAEQLDKVRDIINELDMKQILIVSHESKIESFVDHIIRINKNGHVSSALS